MSEGKKDEAEPGAAAPSEESENEAAALESGIRAEPVIDEEKADAPSAEADDPVARLETEVAGLKDQLLRALAETENLRRRAQREREDTAKYAIANFAKDIVGVADNLRRALDSIPEEARQTDEAIKTVVAGIELTQKDLDSTLERYGIRRIEPLGEPFDHNFHQAMFEVDSDQPAGTVVQLMQAGYVLNDRLLRPAMVGLAKARKDGGQDGNAETSGKRVDTTV